MLIEKRETPLTGRINCVRDIAMRVERTGNIAGSVAETFWWSNITVNVIGNTAAYNSSSSSALFIGDHRNGMEFLPLLSHFGDIGRDNVHFLAKPFSVQTKILSQIAPFKEDLTLPVVPSTLASDRKNKLNRDLHWRVLNITNLPSMEQLKALNSRSIERSAQYIINGDIVVLYPAGGVMDAMSSSWHRGLGRIVKILAERCSDEVNIVPFRFEDFSKIQLMRSLFMRSCGVLPEHLDISLRLGRIGKVGELIGSKTAIREMDPYEITQLLQQQFVDAFIFQQ